MSNAKQLVGQTIRLNGDGCYTLGDEKAVPDLAKLPPRSRALLEWKMDATLAAKFPNRGAYVAYRVNQLTEGQVK